ncbi:hypothetical protein V5799_017971 [Amblyomma americanum]|uniref:Uncharacterized protein n=1 Tax=Amblyomma americanum TaxID=6943 RepID=A0AAQ4F0R6_AMBAM
MPKHLRESMSPEQHEVYLGLQQEPSAFASRQFVIPREKMNDPEVRESLRAYVQSIIEEAAECAEVLKSCARTESLSLPPRTLHKWETKATKSGVRRPSSVVAPVQ